MYNTKKDSASLISQSSWEAANTVLVQIIDFYQKAGISIISDRKACERMIEFLEENSKLRNIPLYRRESDTTKVRLEEMNCKIRANISFVAFKCGRVD